MIMGYLVRIISAPPSHVSLDSGRWVSDGMIRPHIEQSKCVLPLTDRKRLCERVGPLAFAFDVHQLRFTRRENLIKRAQVYTVMFIDMSQLSRVTLIANCNYRCIVLHASQLDVALENTLCKLEDRKCIKHTARLITSASVVDLAVAPCFLLNQLKGQKLLGPSKHNRFPDELFASSTPDAWSVSV